MTSDDELELVARLRALDIVWTPHALAFGDRPQSKEWSEWRSQDAGQRLVCIERDKWSALEWCDLPASEAARPWTMVGVNGSPCFEWSTCVRSSGVIKRGRLFFSSDWLQDGLIHQKPRDVTRWFDRIASWVRRRGKPWKYSYQVVMPGAQKAVRAKQARLVEL